MPRGRRAGAARSRTQARPGRRRQRPPPGFRSWPAGNARGVCETAARARAVDRPRTHRRQRRLRDRAAGARRGGARVGPAAGLRAAGPRARCRARVRRRDELRAGGRASLAGGREGASPAAAGGGHAGARRVPRRPAPGRGRGRERDADGGPADRLAGRAAGARRRAATRFSARCRQRFEAFQWHSYEFAPPRGAQVLAHSPACVEAFRVAARCRGGASSSTPRSPASRSSDWIDDYRSDPDAVAAGIDWPALRARSQRADRALELARRAAVHVLSRARRVAARLEPGTPWGRTR